MEVLIIGGTRNLGHLLTIALLEAGHHVTVFNRGHTRDELPDDVQRLRHVYGDDVVTAITTLIQTGAGKGRAFNISQDETLAVEEFLVLLAGLAGYKLQIARVDRTLLESCDLLPDCSPFSSSWMSELDNGRSKKELGIGYTPLPVYLQKLVAHYESHPPPAPVGYSRRREEVTLPTGAST
ncbi:MAG: hypothetical protein MOB07_05410 [Acidobacteria bacterium]|nr:hypothetical protein [Acidobacteriota bacterium]